MTPEGAVTEDRGTVAEVKHGEDPVPQGLGFLGRPPCACPRHRAAEPVSSATAPLGIATVRDAVRRLLADDAEPPKHAELETLTLQLRGHLELIIPEAESAARGLHRNSIPRYRSLACVGEARGRLASEPCRRHGSAIGHARRLARVLRALCEHYTVLRRTGS